MKYLLLVLIALNSSFAAISIEEKEFPLINEHTTCVDEYIERESTLRKWLIFAPPSTVVAAPVVAVTSAAAVGLGANLVGATGWGVLGAMVGTGMVLGGATVILGVTTEFVTYSKFKNNRLILKSIIEVRSQQDKFIATKKLLRKINRKLNIPLDLTEFKSELAYLDKSNKLCDGSLKRSTRSKKLKHFIATKNDLIRFFK